MEARFEIRRAVNKEFYFVLIAPNNKIILTASEMYKSKQGCNTGISSVRVNSQIDDRFEKRIAKDKSYYSFFLYAGNGEMLGKSETYTQKSGRDNGIQSVKDNGDTLKVDDKS